MELGQAVGDDPLGRQQAHQPEELGLGERPRLSEICTSWAIGWLSASCSSICGRGHLDRHADVGPRRELVEHLLADPADHAGPEPLAERVEVADADDLACGRRRGSRGRRRQPPLGLERHVVDPLDDRGQLLDPVLHRRAGQHQAVGRVQSLDRERRLGRPVLDPLRLVEHDQVRVPAADDLQVAEQLLIIDDEEAFAVRVVDGLALGGRAVDDPDR